MPNPTQFASENDLSIFLEEARNEFAKKANVQVDVFSATAPSGLKEGDFWSQPYRTDTAESNASNADD